MEYVKADPNSAHGTSFHDVEIHMSFDRLVEKLGPPHTTYEPGDKVRYEWCFRAKNRSDRPVTVYDWKTYSDKPREWHVGGWDKWDTIEFKRWFDSL